MSNAFLPHGAIPYDHYIKKEIPSLVQALRENGYRTVAVHPYYDWFWSRNKVYPKLGFEEFISLDGFDHDRVRGWFISDEALVDRIITEIESAAAPFFVHAISMQNHGVYNAHRYAPDEVEVKGEFPEDLRLALQTYVTGLRDADRQLGRLLAYMEARDEPTICLFCGDHLPRFGQEYAIYRESGSVTSLPGSYTLKEYFDMASVPCLIWANKPDLLDTGFIPELVSPVYFPAILLHQLGIDMPSHVKYLSQGIKEYPVIHRQFLWKPDGELVDFVTEKDSPFLRGMEMLQYDILFGEGYSLNKPQETN
jgi:phosphoglycerol transferase MdoB-like AlkP superfamily enzyme